MSTFSQFGGRAATTSVVNACSSGAAVISPESVSARKLLSGALTAATPKELLSVTGGGELPHLSMDAEDNTLRTARLLVVVDGVTVFDASATVGTTVGILAAGVVGGQGAPIRFNSSLSVSVQSSLTETDKIALYYILNRT